MVMSLTVKKKFFVLHNFFFCILFQIFNPSLQSFFCINCLYFRFYLPICFFFCCWTRLSCCSYRGPLMWYPIPWIRFRWSSIDGARVEVQKNWFLNNLEIGFSWNCKAKRITFISFDKMKIKKVAEFLHLFNASW